MSMGHLTLQILVFLWQATSGVFSPIAPGEFGNKHYVCSLWKTCRLNSFMAFLIFFFYTQKLLYISVT